MNYGRKQLRSSYVEYINKMIEMYPNVEDLFPKAPETDGKYVLEVEVKNGIPTYNWKAKK